MPNSQLLCPTCASADVGSADVVECTAHGGWTLDEDGKRAFVPEGTTDVDWDTQVPKKAEEACCRECGWQGAPEAMHQEVEDGPEPYMGYTPGEDARPEPGAIPGERYRA